MLLALAEAIHNYIAVRPADTKSKILLLQASGRPLTKEVLADRIRSLVEAIRTEKDEKKRMDLDVTPHGLRHTCASRWEHLGFTWAEIKQLLGHSSISTTQIYVHTNDAGIFTKVVSIGAPMRVPEPTFKPSRRSLYNRK